MNIKEIKSSIKRYPKFYQKVWIACLTIPKGNTQSYKWIAEKIGSPKAYRAVGNALNKNPFPFLIPCHRVIRSNGTLGGFAKGSKEKKRLLKLEGQDV